MNKPNEIPIFFAVDDNYIPFLSVTLRSLVDNSSEENNYTIKIINTEISKENQAKIKKYETKNIKIQFVNVSKQLNQIKDKLYTRNYFSNTTYYRMFIPELFPEYKKAVYIDSDTVILGDIADLYNEDIGTNLIGAIQDGVIQAIEVFQDYVEKVVGVADYNNYFNAGVLIMNLEELRKFKLQEKFIYLLGVVRYEVAQDQDYFNRICKGRVKIIDSNWNTMPILGEKEDKSKIKLIHFNLGSKPWHFDNVPYQDFFWKYAEKTEFIDAIREARKNYKEEDKIKDDANSTRLIELAKLEMDCVGDDRKLKKQGITRAIMQKVKEQLLLESRKEKKEEKEGQEILERKAILEKIQELEKEGKFDVDAENDPPTIPLEKDKVDYLNKKISSKSKTMLANGVGKLFIRKLLKDNKMIIKEINGAENFKEIKGGAILTCNHFNPYDSMAIESMYRVTGESKKRKLYKVIREGNYTNFPGLYGFFFKNCNTLPLSSKTSTMINFVNAVEQILKHGDYILIYPEQSLWWNYKKPKPLKNGAFKLAAKNNVPVVPIFITMEDSNLRENNGLPIQQYIINIGEPIYPDSKLSLKENTENMKNKNFEVWKNIYEDFYKIPLEYTTANKEEIFNK